MSDALYDLNDAITALADRFLPEGLDDDERDDRLDEATHAAAAALRGAA